MTGEDHVKYNVHRTVVYTSYWIHIIQYIILATATTTALAKLSVMRYIIETVAVSAAAAAATVEIATKNRILYLHLRNRSPTITLVETFLMTLKETGLSEPHSLSVESDYLTEFYFIAYTSVQCTYMPRVLVLL